MGLFDFLNKGKKESKINNGALTPQKEFGQGQEEDVQVGYSDEGKRVQIEFFEPDVKFGQFYDTTRLIVDRAGHPLGNSIVNDCLISWYNQDDAIMAEFDPREDYEQVLATLDVDRLVSDRSYCAFAMKQLLNRKRVQEYLERGKSLEEQEVPCGNYVGAVVQEPDGRLRKRFDCKAGRESHNSPYMSQIREKIRTKREEEKAKRKAELQAELESLK